MTLAAGRHAELTVLDVATGACEVVLRTERHVEAPTWSRDDRWLVVNCDGELYRCPPPGPGPPSSSGRSAPPRDLVALRGGQGTTTVNGWAPDSRRFAFVAYPL